MKNIITAAIEFYFKGKKLSPSITLDLDSRMQSTGKVPVLYPLIANQNNIDLYSYEYEMMQSEPIKVNHAEGLVEKYIIDGTLDITAFEAAWHDQHIHEKIQQLVEQHKLTELVQQHPEIEQTLIEAYRLGKNNSFN